MKNKGTNGTQRQLHVALHGLICIRLSEGDGTATLHIPAVDGTEMPHVYTGGDFANRRTLARGDRLHLKGVRPGNYAPARCANDEFAIASVADIADRTGCRFMPHDTHSTVALPWPADLNRVRLLAGGCVAYTYGGGKNTINPKQPGYVSYLTYDLDDGDCPALLRGHEHFWFSEGLNTHTCLHLFANPSERMTGRMHDEHLRMAYGSTGEQLFNPALDLQAVPSQLTWADPVCGDIPDSEQRDTAECNRARGVTMFSDIGNCLPVVFVD